MVEFSADIGRLPAIEKKIGLGTVTVAIGFVPFEQLERHERIEESRAPRSAIPTSVVSASSLRGPLARTLKTPSSTALNSALLALKALPSCAMRSG